VNLYGSSTPDKIANNTVVTEPNSSYLKFLDSPKDQAETNLYHALRAKSKKISTTPSKKVSNHNWRGELFKC
jgi:hypothetical protein